MKAEIDLVCRVCGAAALEEFPQFARLPRVTSDCRPFPAGGRLAMLDDGVDRGPLTVRAPLSLRARIVTRLPLPVRRILRAGRTALRRRLRAGTSGPLARGH